MKFVALNMVERGESHYDEDTGMEVASETTKPVVVNAESIRCFYPRKGGKVGTRITFMDGGGFAVAEEAAAVATAVAGTNGARLVPQPALAPPADA